MFFLYIIFIYIYIYYIFLILYIYINIHVCVYVVFEQIWIEPYPCPQMVLKNQTLEGLPVALVGHSAGGHLALLGSFCLGQMTRSWGFSLMLAFWLNLVHLDIYIYILKCSIVISCHVQSKHQWISDSSTTYFSLKIQGACLDRGLKWGYP